MLVLTFRVDQIVYAVPVRQVIEVVPRVELRQVPHAPECFLGLLHYRGAAIPVIDLSLLMGRSACLDRLDTRILLVHSSRAGNLDDRLGLLAEQVNELVEVDDARMAMSAVFRLNAPYLGEVYETKTGLLQLIDPGQIALATVTDSPGAIEP